MTRQLRRAADRRVEHALLGGAVRSGFAVDVLAFVDGVSDLAFRLERRGWDNQSSGPDLMWDWLGTALPEAEWTARVRGLQLPCTSIAVSEDVRLVEVTLVGHPDETGAGLSVSVDVVDDNCMAELEVYRPGEPVPARLQGG